MIKHFIIIIVIMFIILFPICLYDEWTYEDRAIREGLKTRGSGIIVKKLKTKNDLKVYVEKDNRTYVSYTDYDTFRKVKKGQLVDIILYEYEYKYVLKIILV